MDRLDILEKKVLQAAEQLSALRQERQRLQEEIRHLEEENRKIQALLQEGDLWRDQKRAVTTRIEKILKKLNAINN